LSHNIFKTDVKKIAVSHGLRQRPNRHRIAVPTALKPLQIDVASPPRELPVRELPDAPGKVTQEGRRGGSEEEQSQRRQEEGVEEGAADSGGEV
jgi:hypothetical protein